MYYNGEDIRKRRLEIRDNIAKSLGIEGGYDEIEKARNVGDMHPNGKWVWKEYKPGKFDWRTAKKGDIAAAGLNKPMSPREAKMKSLAEEYCKRFDLRLEEMIPAGFLARQATDSKNAEGKSRKKYSYAWFFVDTASGDVSQVASSERTLGQLKKKLKAADDKVKAKIDAQKESLNRFQRGTEKASKSKKENKPKHASSIHSYLDNPKFDLSSDQKKVASHLNEKLKSFMGMNESNVSLKDVQEAMGWNKNKTRDIVGALVSKEVLAEKIVPSMDGNDYKTYHFKDQENMTYKPTDKKDKN